MTRAGRNSAKFVQIIFGVGKICTKENIYIDQTFIHICKTSIEKNSHT